MSTPSPEELAQWHREWERIGETVIRAELELRSGQNVGITSEAKRVAVYEWLRVKERDRAELDRATFRYVKWTFWAAVAAAVIGIVGVVVTLMH